MIRKDIREYINLLRRFNKHFRLTGQMTWPKEDDNLVKKYENLYENDIEWNKLINSVKSIEDEEEQDRIVEAFLKNEENTSDNLNMDVVKYLPDEQDDVANQLEQEPKPKVFQKRDNRGFSNALLLSLITGFFGGMMTTMVIQLLKIKSM